jgi:hypothetical protein
MLTVAILAAACTPGVTPWRCSNPDARVLRLLRHAARTCTLRPRTSHRGVCQMTTSEVPTHAQLQGRRRCATPPGRKCEYADRGAAGRYKCPQCKKWACFSYGGGPDPRCDTCVVKDIRRQERRSLLERSHT